MPSFAIRAFNFKAASLVKKAFCDFLKAASNLSECRIDDLPPFFHTLTDEFRKLAMLDMMIPGHLV